MQVTTTQMHSAPQMPWLRYLLVGLVAVGASGLRAQEEEAAAEAPAEGGEAADGETSEGETGEEPPKSVSDEVFDDAVTALTDGSFINAAEGFYVYLDGNEANVDNFEWAEFYLGEALRNLGFHHAASEYYFNVAKEQKRPEILPQALKRIEFIINRRPHDETLLVDDLIGSTEFGTLAPERRAFVSFEKGRLDLKGGREDWANLHFSFLEATLERQEEKNPTLVRYLERATFAKAITVLAATHNPPSLAVRKKRAEAAKSLETLLKRRSLEQEMRNETLKVLARLAFENGKFNSALRYYNRVKTPFLSREEASLFLEKAWTMYYAGDPRGTLGILLTLDAPSYRRHFQPERFILKALSYQSLCHYAAAKGAAREFARRYGASLRELRRLRTPTADPVVRRAAVQGKKPKEILAFLATLRDERSRVDGTFQEPALVKHLARVYDLKIEETVRRLDRSVEAEADRVAEELLEYEEQARLVDYEVSLEVFRRVRAGKDDSIAPEPEKAIPVGGDDVYYVFEGEYWNDELHDYRFRIDDRCVGEGLFR